MKQPALGVVVDDFDMCRSSFIPNKAYAPLIVDPDRMLSLSIGSQRLEAIARRYAKIAQDPCPIQKTQFSQSDILDVRR